MHSALSVAFLMVFYSGRVAYSSTEVQMRSLLDAKLNSTDYSSRVRPIRDTGNILSVTVNMYLVGLNDVDEVEQKITTTAYLTISWADTFLTWTPGDYGGITKIAIPQERIWKPDLALANAYDTISGLGDKFIYLSINYQGVITWQPYQVFDSTCSLDMTYFPFDTQKCDIQLVTWSSTKEMISLVAGTDQFNIANYETNANWDLLEASVFDSSTTTTAGLSFRLTIKRKPVYFLINFIIPIILLSVLNVFVFALPCDSGEKTSYAIILFLSFAIFLLIVTEIMPEGMNTIPVMSTYLLMECVLSTIIVFITIIQLRFHNQGDETPVPRILQSFVGVILLVRTKVCCLGAEKKGSGDDDDDNTEIKMAVLSKSGKETAASEKRKEALGDNDQSSSSDSASTIAKRLISKSNTRVKDLLYGRKVTPITLFNKPDVKVTPYEHNLEVQDLEYELWNSNVNQQGKNTPVKTKNGTISNNGYANGGPANSTFTAKRKQSLVESDDGSSDDGAPENTTWSDVSSAIDSLCFVLFFILNTLAMIVALAVMTSN